MSPDPFHAWLQDVSPESFEDGASIDDAWMTWFRGVYAKLGPISRERVDTLARQRIDETLAAQPWIRIVNDVGVTTGRRLRLDVTCDTDTAWIELSVTVDDEFIGTMGRGYSLANPEALVAEMAGYLREFALDEAIWGGWPICVHHPTHPLEPVLSDGLACWVCPETGRTVGAIGELKEVG